MRGSKAFARPATLTRSGTGKGCAGEKRDLMAIVDNKATRMAVMSEAHDLVILSNFRVSIANAFSKGSVLCWTSARTAKRISNMVRQWPSSLVRATYSC